MKADAATAVDAATPSAPHRYYRVRYRTRSGNVYVMDRVRAFDAGQARSIAGSLKPGCRILSVVEAGPPGPAGMGPKAASTVAATGSAAGARRPRA